MMKRKLAEHLMDMGESVDDIFISPRPYKRISMCDNTPKQAKDEKKKLLKTSKRKLKQMEHPEANLCRSVLVNNVYKKLQAELRQEKSTKYYGYAFNPKCPLGFGDGGTMQEFSERKRVAKLEQLLEMKKERQLQDSLVCDSDNESICDSGCSAIIDGSCDEQLLRLCSDIQRDNYYYGNLNNTKSTSSLQTSSLHTPYASIVDNPISSIPLGGGILSPQDITAAFCGANEGLVSSSASTQTNSITSMDTTTASDSMECDTTPQSSLSSACDNNTLLYTSSTQSPLACDSIISNNLSSSLDYDSETDEEIDVCSCEDDESQMLSSSKLLQQQQQEEEYRQQIQIQNNNNSAMEYNAYHLEDNKENILRNISTSTSHESNSCDFPPKPVASSDLITEDDTCTSCDSNRNNDHHHQHLRGTGHIYNNNSNLFNGSKNSNNTVNSGNASPPTSTNNTSAYPQTSTEQGQLHSSIYQGGLSRHSVTPFCHPSLLSTSFYQGFLFPSSMTSGSGSVNEASGKDNNATDSVSAAVAAYGSLYSSSFAEQCYLQGLQYTNSGVSPPTNSFSYQHSLGHYSTSGSNLAANMVTCT